MQKTFYYSPELHHFRNVAYNVLPFFSSQAYVIISSSLVKCHPLPSFWQGLPDPCNDALLLLNTDPLEETDFASVPSSFLLPEMTNEEICLS